LSDSVFAASGIPRIALMAPAREEVFRKIRAHLSDELGIEASAIEETSRFKEDLEADSLDLVELVMELEDGYGIRMPEDEAERIKTVGQAIDFVLSHASATSTP
jgi:acyl carrier protein